MDEVLIGLPTADKARGPLTDEHDSRSWETVVVARHRMVVGAGRLDRNDVTRLGVCKRDVVDEGVGLTVLARYAVGASRWCRRSVRNHRGVDGVVELRSRVVRHATVNRNECPVPRCLRDRDRLRRTDGVERRASLTDN